MNEWTLTIPGKRPPRPGDGHWGVVKRAKDQWANYIGFLAIQRKIPKCLPGERRSVQITFYRPGPVSDKDNAAAACKVPLDALTRVGLIEDDRPSCIDLDFCTVSASPSRTVIVLRRI